MYARGEIGVEREVAEKQEELREIQYLQDFQQG